MPVLERSQLVPRPLPCVFAFFQDPANLARITPPRLAFRTVSDAPRRIDRGAFIRYRIRWLGIPLGWTTRIVEFEQNARFVDEQVRGPYARWVHEHRFEPRGACTLVRDRVAYELPLGWIGRLVHRLIVRRQLERIFDYRARRIQELFP